jgi:adenosylhomocysteine nucleosidase
MLIISVALFAEAKPIINHFHLKQNTNITNFKIWENDRIRLVITGTGKEMAAASIAFVAAKTQDISAFLNIGIAGHRDLDIGEVILASKVKDFSSKKSYYPSLIVNTPLKLENILTFDKIEKNYIDDYCHDMESSGFCASASKFLPCDLICVLKIISDNNLYSIGLITEKKISSLIEEKINIIENVIDKITITMNKYKESKGKKMNFETYIEKYKLSSSQKKNLKDVLENLYFLNPKKELETTNPNEVLIRLKENLKNTPLSFSKKKVYD